MSSSEEDVSNFELLFKKVSIDSQWNGSSPERCSFFSLSPNNFMPSKEEFPRSSAFKNISMGSASKSFLPSLIRCDGKTSFNKQGIDISENSLGDLTAKKIEIEGSEDSSEIEDRTLFRPQTTAQELEDEEKCENKDDTPVGYLDKQLFPILLPCLEKMLFAAKEHDVLKVQKSRFNGLDYLAELLWNNNPLHPERRTSHVPIFNIPFVKKHLEENPRPVIPQSWLWTRDQAAIMIQSAIRGYLVRCQPRVQELRQFWKTLAEEKKQQAEKLTMLSESTAHFSL